MKINYRQDEFDSLLTDVETIEKELETLQDEDLIQFDNTEEEDEFTTAISGIKDCKEILESIAEAAIFNDESGKDRS